MRVVRKRSRMRVNMGEGRGSWSITVANVILLVKKFYLREGSWNQSSNMALDLK